MKTIALLIVFAANVVLAAYYLSELHRLHKWEREVLEMVEAWEARKHGEDQGDGGYKSDRLGYGDMEELTMDGKRNCWLDMICLQCGYVQHRHKQARKCLLCGGTLVEKGKVD